MKKFNFYKLRMSSFDISVGNIKKNSKSLLKQINDGSNSFLTVTPYLSLTSLGVESLFLKRDFQKEVLKEVENIIDKTTNKNLFTLTIPLVVKSKISISTIVVFNKKVIGLVPQTTFNDNSKNIYTTDFGGITKTELFDKEVPFGKLVIKENNLKLAVLNGCDSNNIDLINEYAKNDVNLLLDISSDFEILNSGDVKFSKVKYLSKQYNLGYLYISPSETETVKENIYASDKIFAENGEIVDAISGIYEDDLFLDVDFDLDSVLESKLKNKNIKILNSLSEVSIKLKDSTDYKFQYIDKNPFLSHDFVNKEIESLINLQVQSLTKKITSLNKNMQKVVIGISGGLDSTLTLLAAVMCFDNLNIERKNIITLLMPTKNTTSKSYAHAKKLVEYFNTEIIDFSIDEEVKQTLKALKHTQKDIVYENAQARIRTMHLMNAANKYNAIVLGTGDLSEIALGYMTFSGDQLGMYSVNASIPKTVIKEMVLYFSEYIYFDIKDLLNEIVFKKISAELNKNQETEKEVGNYEINDFIMYHFLKNGWSKEKLIYVISDFFKLDSTKSKEYVDRFFKLFLKNQFKLKLLSESSNLLGICFGASGFMLPSDHEKN